MRDGVGKFGDSIESGNETNTPGFGTDSSLSSAGDVYAGSQPDQGRCQHLTRCRRHTALSSLIAVKFWVPQSTMVMQMTAVAVTMRRCMGA